MSIARVDRAIQLHRLRGLVGAGQIAVFRQLCRSGLLGLRLIDEAPDLPWDYAMLSDHPGVDAAYVRARRHHQWDWKRLSLRGGEFFAADLCGADPESRIDAEAVSSEAVLPHLDPGVVAAHPGLGWDWRELTLRKSLPLSFLLAHAELPWHLDALSYKSDVTLDDVLSHPQLPWQYEVLAGRVPIDDILAHPHLPWSWQYASINTSVNDAVLERVHDAPWDYVMLSLNDSVSLAYVLAHPDRPWNMHFVAAVKCKDFANNLDAVAWDWAAASANGALTVELVAARPDLAWDWALLSANPALRVQGIAEHPALPWDWAIVSTRPDVSDAVLGAHPELPWNWRYVTSSPGVSCDFIAQHADRPWDWATIMLKRSMTLCFVRKFEAMLPPMQSIACYDPGVLLRATASERAAFARRHVAARKIQRTWLRLYYDPTRCPCRKRLRREFDELVQCTSRKVVYSKRNT